MILSRITAGIKALRGLQDETTSPIQVNGGLFKEVPLLEKFYLSLFMQQTKLCTS